MRARSIAGVLFTIAGALLIGVGVYSGVRANIVRIILGVVLVLYGIFRMRGGDMSMRRRD